MAWPLARKVSAALLGILVGTVATTGFFTYTKLQGVLASLVQSRYGVQVYAIKRNVEDRLALGFPLKELRPVQDVIDSQKVDDRRIRGIEVFDGKGVIQFDTDRGAIGSTVPSSWREAAMDTGNRPFAEEDEDGRIVGLPLINSLGAAEGGVVLRYPGASLQDALAPVMGRLAREAALVLVLFAAVAVIGSHLLFSRVRRRLEAMQASLSDVVAEGASPAEGEVAATFEGDFAAFAAKAHETLRDLADTSTEVERLDRLA